MDIIKTIRAEIERLKDENNNIRCDSNKAYCQGYGDAFVDLLPLLDTLQEQENTPSWKKIHVYEGPLEKGDMEKMLLDLSVGKGERRTKVALPDRIVDILESEKPSNPTPREQPMKFTKEEARAIIILCVDEGLKQGIVKTSEYEELLDYLYEETP